MGPGAAPPSGAKCGWISRAPSAATKLDGESSSLAGLAPRAQGVEQPRRDLAQQRAGDGVRIAQNLGCGFVDQANPVGRIDDQEALAQVLHDVLGQIGEVGQIEVFLPNQIFAFAHAGCEDAGGGCNGEQHEPEKAGGRIDIDVHMARELLPNRMQQNGDRGNGRQEQRAAWRQEESQTADRHE